MPIASVNPTTGETLKTFEPLSETQIDEKLQQASQAFRSYRQTSLADRERWMLGAAEILETEKQNLARLMTTEMGKPIKGAVGEAEKCAWVCRYYAETAKHHLADKVVETNASRSYVRFQPLGPVLAVMLRGIFPFGRSFLFCCSRVDGRQMLVCSNTLPMCRSVRWRLKTFSAALVFPAAPSKLCWSVLTSVQRILTDRRVVAATLTG